MRQRRSLRAIAAASVGLVVLLAVELPAIAYPRTPDAAAPAAARTVKHRLTATLLYAGVPQLRSVGLHRNLPTAEPETEEDDVWVPTLPEGSAFTVIGAGLICGGGVVFGVGMARLAPIVAEYSGLVTAAVGPLVMAGVGLTLLFVGVPLLIHGIKALKAVRAAEQQGGAVSALWRDDPLGPAPLRIRQTVLLRF